MQTCPRLRDVATGPADQGHASRSLRGFSVMNMLPLLRPAAAADVHGDRCDARIGHDDLAELLPDAVSCRRRKYPDWPPRWR